VDRHLQCVIADCSALVNGGVGKVESVKKIW
jgi:hypothetical protein